MPRVITPREGYEYDPAKSYRWEPEDIFEMTGLQFGTLVNMLEAEMNTPGGAPLSLKVKAYEVITEIIKLGVEQGAIRENIPYQGEASSRVKSLFENQNTKQDENQGNNQEALH
jgi:hypothetical protein